MSHQAVLCYYSLTRFMLSQGQRKGIVAKKRLSQMI